jgi:hypothetical protein
MGRNRIAVGAVYASLPRVEATLGSETEPLRGTLHVITRTFP